MGRNKYLGTHLAPFQYQAMGLKVGNGTCWSLTLEQSVNNEGPQQTPVPREAGDCDSSAFPSLSRFLAFTREAASGSQGRVHGTMMAGYCWPMPAFLRPRSTHGCGGCPVAVLGCGECVGKLRQRYHKV